MRYFRLSALALFACRVLPVLSQAAAEKAAAASDGDSDPLAPGSAKQELAVHVSTSFPASEIFGVKLVNGRATQALVTIKNNEPTREVAVAFVGGNLWTTVPVGPGGADGQAMQEKSVNVRNLTTTRYNVKIPAGQTDSIDYNFATELHAQDLRLQIVAVVTTPDDGNVYSLNAFNETVSVVEPDASLFDPQLIFLYIMLAGLFAGSVYFIYNTWIATLFPQAAKGGKTGDRARKPQGTKKTDTPSSAANGAEGQAVATGSFDASWIPEHHINKPEAKRLKSGGGKPKKA